MHEIIAQWRGYHPASGDKPPLPRAYLHQPLWGWDIAQWQSLELAVQWTGEIRMSPVQSPDGARYQNWFPIGTDFLLSKTELLVVPSPAVCPTA